MISCMVLSLGQHIVHHFCGDDALCQTVRWQHLLKRLPSGDAVAAFTGVWLLLKQRTWVSSSTLSPENLLASASSSSSWRGFCFWRPPV